jgi:hypothetical protein
MDSAEDLQALRRRVRTLQHARSFPLLVFGALFINYGVTGFGPSPVQWRYGAPLAFVLVWVLLKVNESTVGVGTGRVDYLAAAFVVFALTSLTLIQRFIEHLRGASLPGIWVGIVGLALLFVAWSAGDRLLALLAMMTVAVGGFTAVFGYHHDIYFDSEKTLSLFFPQNVLVIGLGSLLALVGLITYRQERRLAE